MASFETFVNGDKLAHYDLLYYLLIVMSMKSFIVFGFIYYSSKAIKLNLNLLYDFFIVIGSIIILNKNSKL